MDQSDPAFDLPIEKMRRLRLDISACSAASGAGAPSDVLTDALEPTEAMHASSRRGVLVTDDSPCAELVLAVVFLLPISMRSIVGRFCGELENACWKPPIVRTSPVAPAGGLADCTACGFRGLLLLLDACDPGLLDVDALASGMFTSFRSRPNLLDPIL